MRHGNYSTYTNLGCRCLLCRAANRRYSRAHYGYRGRGNRLDLDPLQVALKADTTLVRTEVELRQALTAGRVFVALPGGRP